MTDPGSTAGSRPVDQFTTADQFTNVNEIATAHGAVAEGV